ncbi:hypothetical protein KAH81_02185 [bacterium]|nr:hypothetical protein [bacterium]
MGRITSCTILIAALIVVIALPVFAQYGSSTSYNLQWKSIQSGGNEGDDVTSTSYRLSSSIGQSTPVTDGPLSSTSFDLYSGHRKIDVDFRYPFSWFTFAVEYASDTSWVLTWSGIDTTAEDGWGWGIWNYDVQYSIGGGAWTPWRDATTDTFATFGPSLPVAVIPGMTYNFRIRARDLARNEAPWGDQDTVIVNYVVEFCVYTDPGLPTDELNYITLSYNNDLGVPIVEHIWEGHCAQVWCVPGTQAEVSRLSTASDDEERWMVNSTDDTIWVIDGTEADYNVRYWHQLNPMIVLDGTDPTHTVATLNHEQFGPGHVEGGLWETWQEWTDWGSIIEFTDTTTGIPTLRAVAWDSTRFHDVDGFFTDTIHYMAASNVIVVQTSFGGDSVRIDGSWLPSPYYTDWFDMSTHEIAVKDTVWISACEIWVFDYWEDSPSAPTVRNVTITGDSIFTADYHHEFKFDVANPSGLGTPVPPVGSYWRDEGDTVEGSITPLIVGDSVLVGYNGTGSLPSGAGSEFWFEIYDCSSIEWRWTPVGEMCTLWVFSPYGHPSPDGMWIVPNGTMINCSVEESTYVDGAWHELTGWRGDGAIVPATGTDNEVAIRVTGTCWLVWEWEEDWMPLIVGSEPSYHGSPVPDTGTHWLDYATLTSAWVTNPDGLWWCTGYEANYWGSVPSTSADSVSFIIDSPTFIDWQWEFSPAELCTLWVFSPYGEPVPGIGMHVYPAGHSVTAMVPTPAAGHDCSGWIGTGSAPLSGVSNTVTFTIDETSTITWQWGEDVVPLVVQNPGDHDTPEPPVGIHYYTIGSEVDAWVTSPDGMWFCTGYEGYGSVPDSSYEDSLHFTITEPSGITWIWDSDVVYLDVTAPAYSDAFPLIGRSYHPRGRVIFATVVDTFYEDADHRSICTGWLGDGTVVPTSGIESSVSIVMTDNGTLDWQYSDQYQLTLDHVGLPGGVDPTGLGVEGWYNDGDTATLVTDSVIWDSGIPFAFMFWDSGDESPTIGNTLSHNTWILMDEAYAVTAMYERGVLVDIIKSPMHDSPGWIIVDGDTTFDGIYSTMWAIGSRHSIEVSVVDSTDTIRYVFDAWRDAPSEAGLRDVAPITDTTFFADYFTDYHYILTKSPVEDTLGVLNIDAIGYTGIASVRQDVWWREGSTHDITVTDVDSSLVVKYIFHGWSDGVSTPSRSIGPITHHDSLSANYNTQYLCRVVKDPLEYHGSIYFDGVAYPDIGEFEAWVDEGYSFPVAVSKFDTVADSLYRFIAWEDGPIDTFRVVGPFMAPDTFVALYEGIQIDLHIEIGHHRHYPCDSVFWNIRDSLDWEETITMSPVDSMNIHNLSNVPVDFGLMISGIIDTNIGWRPDTFWSPGSSTDDNIFVLRGRFNDNPEPPITWWLTRDFIIETVYWAINEGGAEPAIFGPGGENIPPVTEPNNTEKLWLQFKAPRNSNNANHTRVIILRLYVKAHLE